MFLVDITVFNILYTLPISILTGELRSFIFNVTIDMLRIMCIILFFVFCFFSLFHFPIFFSYLPLLEYFSEFHFLFIIIKN